MGTMQILLKGNPIFEHNLLAIAESLKINLPQDADVYFRPVVFQSVADLEELKLANCGITNIGSSWLA